MSKYRAQFRAREAHWKRVQQLVEDDCRRSGHSRPRTRRDFISRGLIAAGATVFLPSLAGMSSRSAYAAECIIDNNPQLGAGMIPFIGIDQRGGANISGSNIIVGGPGGQEDFLAPNGYGRMGLPEAILPQNVGVDRTFGLAMHPNSALLRGMLDKTSAATRANTNGCVVPARSENDTGNNPHNPVYGIARAGSNGEFAVSVGTSNSESGGRSRAPDSMILPELRPTRVRNRNDAIGLGGGDTGGFPNDQVATASGILTALKLNQINEAQATEELVQCGFDRTTATFNTNVLPADLDPEADPIIADIFAGEDITRGDFERAAAVMKVVIEGYAGAGTIEFGGRDYHQDPRPETDGKDFVVGQVIGAALEYANRQGQPLMIYGFSDGSVAADTNLPEDDGQGVVKYRWRSDDSSSSSTFMLVHSPAGRPVLRDGDASQQLGHFNPNGGVDTSSSPFANSVNALAEMVVLNYMALHGQQGLFGNVLDNPSLGTGAAVDPFIAFNPIV